MTLPLPQFRLFTPALSAAVLLAGCAAVPDLGPKPTPRGPESIAASQSLPATPSAQWPADGWWTAFGDPQLDALVQEGLANSPDVAVAMARLRRAGGAAQQAGAATLPTVDVDGKAGYARQSLNMGYPDEFKQFLPKGWQQSGQIAANLSFDLDLWGKNRAALAAATSDERAAAIDAAQARLMLSTGIASAYFELARLQAERDVRQKALDVRDASRKLVGDRQANGLDTRGSLRQSEAEVASAKVALSEVDQAIAARRNQIAALMGAGPDRGLAITAPALAARPAPGLPEGATTDLIGRRPDIVAARERAEAAASRIKVAHADFFPSLRLDALIGLQSLGFSNLIDNQSVYGNVGPAISLPIFHGGAIQGGYRVARANYDEAVATYDKTVIGAYQDVADAVTSQRLIAQRLVDARAAVTASEEAYSIAQGRYRGGLSNYLDVLTVEDRVLQARLVLAGLEAAARSADLALIRALGGGFQTPISDKDVPHG
jgi:NodT family efflux transporter outer membrane factor (OMF) lipoprotein